MGSAKNVLINHNDFSPAQLVFGKASNLPSTINDHLSAFTNKRDSSSQGKGRGYEAPGDPRVELVVTQWLTSG